jgi:hypothetical protein
VKTETIGTVVGGVLQLDQRLHLPDNSRVRVVVEPLGDWRIRLQTGLAAWKQLRQTHPINSGGCHYTRDQLHERR